jgi:hypothetical protein
MRGKKKGKKREKKEVTDGNGHTGKLRRSLSSMAALRHPSSFK